MAKDAYQIFKETCTRACHARHACADGYKQMLAAENVSQMMNTWRCNWEDIVESKYADIICIELPKHYSALKAEMNQSGIYLNECPTNARSFVSVLITDFKDVVHVYGDAKAYIIGKAEVHGHDHSQIYNSKIDDAVVALYDYAFGKILSGKVTAYNRSSLQTSCVAVLDGSVKCSAFGGNVYACAYREVYASRDTVVYSNSRRNIFLHGTAHIEPLNLKDIYE